MSTSSKPFTETPGWGITFPQQANSDESLAVVTALIPRELVVPLLQHTGNAADPLVRVGERVLTGQPVGAMQQHKLGARVHASSSGTVTSIAMGKVPGRRDALCVTIQTDGKDERWPGYHSRAKPLRLSTSELRKAVIEAGIVGLGGATFPAGIKLNRGTGVETLILNGAECEPCINCDDALLRTEAQLILLGAQVMLRILEADNCIIAIKHSMHTAAAALDEALFELADDRFRVEHVPALYPIGGEAQLIQRLTDQEMPSGGLPWDSGAICQNVGTALAVARFLSFGEPLIRRMVTVTGGGIKQPVNLDTRLGTPLNEIIAAAGGYTGEPSALIMGGPMMGIPLDSDTAPITKASNCIYVPAPSELAVQHPEMPCIRCGDCSTACPANLMPQLLLQAGKTNDFDRLQSLGLTDCIECGCCDYVCPSHIPLTQGFVAAKQKHWELAFERKRADKAAQRYAARETRLARDKAAQNHELAEQTEGLNSSNDADAALRELLQRVGNKNNQKD